MSDQHLSEADIFAAGTEPHVQEQQPGPEPHQPEPAPQDQEPQPEPAQGEGQPQPEPQQPRQEDPFARERSGFLSDLKAERERRQEFERQLAERDRQMAEQMGRMRQMEEFFRQASQPRQQPQAPQQAPDPYEDPQGFARFQAQQVVERQLSPILERQQQYEQRTQAIIQGMQRQVAVGQYGADAAREAEEAFNTAAARNAIDRHEWERIQSAPNPFTAAVEWHQRQRTLETVGTDPSKWFETEFQRRAQQDPAFQQQMFALLNGQAREAAGAPAPAAPGAK
ncbi:hypothetical protein VQ02_27480, partial [Methylobacterium variabile]